MDGTQELMAVMIAAAREAGALALAARAAGLRPEAKSDRSPVTEADREAERIILARLADACPALPVVAEESAAAGRLPERLGRRFLLVDPIDGTREFIAGRPEFTVNIALVEETRPVVGVVHAPALGTLYLGTPGGAVRQRDDGGRETIRVSRSGTGMRALASRSHRTAETDAFLARHAITDVSAVGSSLKFCRLAEGEADLYPCFGTTMEWDTAAGQAVLEAAGGRVVEPDGAPLAYGGPERAGAPRFRNPFFVALGAISLPSTS